MAEKSFKQQLKTGFIYTALARYSGILISICVTAILSRLLPPEDFGVIAVATVFIVFFSIFSDMGLSAAIVQKRDLTPLDLKSLYSYSIYLGIILSVIFFCLSWVISNIYGDKQLIPICQLLSFNVLFATWNIVPNGLLFRDKLFKFIGIRTIIIQLILATVSIIAAYGGLGVYALLINPIGSSMLIYLLSYIKVPVGFTFRPDYGSIKKVAGYSGYTFGFSLINYFTRNLDKLLIGKIFGMVPLGYYEKSYRLMLLPVQNLTQVITPVLHPVLADFQDDVKQQSYKYIKLLEILALVGFPISAFLYFSAEPLILLLFGSQWIPSIGVFKILSLSVGLQITGSTTGAFLQATNKTKQLFYLGTINTLVNVSGLLVGLFVIKSIEGVAWMWVLTMYIGLWNNWMIAKFIGINIWGLFKPYKITILPTLITILILSIFNLVFKFGLIIQLIINGITTLVILLIFIRWFKIFDILPFIEKRISFRGKHE